jgi:hypothetical protein
LALLCALALSCTSRHRDNAPAPSVTASAPKPAPATTCTVDADCVPMNCCYAAMETSCIPKGRSNCDKFAIECAEYNGPRYSCACKEGACVGKWASAGTGSSPDAAAAPAQASIASGDLAARDVLGVIMSHAADVRACRARSPKAAGVLTLGWTVKPSGVVDKQPEVLAGMGMSSTLTNCLKKKVGAWRFPKAKGPTRVTYGFRFG